MAPDLTRCANCGVSADDTSIHLRSCQQCKSIVYCSKVCQKNEWHRHKEECIFLQDLSLLKNHPGNRNCLPEGLMLCKKWWSEPSQPSIDGLMKPGIPPVTGGLYTLKLKNRLFNNRLCVVLGNAPNNRITVLCTKITDDATQNTNERPVCVRPESLQHHGVINLDDDWYGYSFAKSYPILYETAFLHTLRVMTVLNEMGLSNGAQHLCLIPIIPTLGAATTSCHCNVQKVCRIQQSSKPIFGYSLLPGLSCGSLNIESHSVLIQKSGEYIDVTPDYDSLTAKFFVQDPKISYDEFRWLQNIRIMRLQSLNRKITPLNISPDPAGRAFLPCTNCNCKCSKNQTWDACLLPRKLALPVCVIEYARDHGVDFSLSNEGGPIICPPYSVTESILDPKWEWSSK